MKTRAAASAAGQGQAEKSARRWGDLTPRILSGLLMIALALGTAFLGGQPFALFWLVAGIAIIWEWQRLIGREGAGLRFAGGALGLAMAAASAALAHPGAALLALGGGVILAGLVGPGRRVMAALGVLYAGLLVLPAIWLRGSTLGLSAVLWLFAVVWGTDVMAYFGGRVIGGPKLSPRLSPSKTWSGLLVGVSAGALAGWMVAPPESRRLVLIAVGLLAGVLAQAGDILESSLKRRYGVKDASHLIPGHGGVMDRLDGFIVAALFAVGLGAARAGLDAAGLGLLNWP